MDTSYPTHATSESVASLTFHAPVGIVHPCLSALLSQCLRAMGSAESIMGMQNGLRGLGAVFLAMISMEQLGCGYPWLSGTGQCQWSAQEARPGCWAQ